MGNKPGQQIVAYWLCPAEPARQQFAAIIEDLATRFDAPLFEPHLTIYVASADREDPGAVLKKVLHGLQPCRLVARAVDYSDKFTKTLFVQFESDAGLGRLSEDFRRASASPGDYQLNPHVSLLYKKMEQETKRELAASITLPFGEVVFDSAKAVLSPAEIKSRAEVEAWRIVAERELTE